MRRIERCPCCEGSECEPRPALVSPFIAGYVLQRPVMLCVLRQCSVCGFRFFEDRYEAAEVARLYADYRGPSYFAARHRYEPWYTQRINDKLGASAVERQRRIASALRPHLGRVVGSVLDYGGDAGQHIPEDLARERFVFELSSVLAVPGVSRVEREEDLRRQGYDVVLLCQVLEHHADPAALVGRLRELVAPGGIVYVEVPAERPVLGLLGKGPLYAAYLRLLVSAPALRTVADFYSTAFRTLLGVVPPLGFLKLHEHINFFTPRSLALLLERSGCSVLSCERRGADIFCVAQPRA